MSKRSQKTELPETKRKLLDAGGTLMRRRGINETTRDKVCPAGGVTKGGFFHYFKSKEDLATAAIIRFHELRAGESADAPFRRLVDPLDRVFGRLDFAKEASGGSKGLTKGCLIGMFAQELSSTNPEVRLVCEDRFARIAKDFETDLAEAKARYAPRAAFDPNSLAMMYVSIMQGSLMLAKASESNRVLVENLEQFRAYLQFLFGRSRGSLGKQTKVSVESRN